MVENKLTTLAFHIDSTAFVTEVVSTAAPHVITPTTFLDPIATLGTLFELLSFRKFDKGLIVSIMFVRDLMFFAALSSMIGHATVQAIVRITVGTLELRLCIILIEEGIGTICCGTPRDVWLEFQTSPESKSMIPF